MKGIVSTMDRLMGVGFTAPMTPIDPVPTLPSVESDASGRDLTVSPRGRLP